MPTLPASLLGVASALLCVLLMAVAILGCTQAPPAATTVSSKPVSKAATQAAHTGEHDHAAGGEHHEHDEEDEDEDGEHDEDEDEDHDHAHGDHTHPTTLAEGVTALEKTARAVHEHLQADAREAADDAIHALGHLLEDLPGLIKSAPLADEARATATKAVDDLFDCFDKLDTALHAEAGKADPPAEVHASLAERIGGAIAALRGTVPAVEAEEDR